ncbi:unnamed protein product [Caenorhabditis angaria]|uniref:Uncharacterized protein n=1 Tax=Caenorhabditis angaria TaxID=860376 RepID=A0A9P1I2F1_9PELO|nr:unnamed protein product [Caenorhabditis angaria]
MEVLNTKNHLDLSHLFLEAKKFKELLNILRNSEISDDISVDLSRCDFNLEETYNLKDIMRKCVSLICHGTKANFEVLFDSMSNLRKFTISSTEGIRDQMILANLISNNKNLEDVVIIDMKIRSLSPSPILLKIIELENLKTLNLSGNKWINEEDWRILLGELKNLEELKMNNTESMVEFEAEMLPKLTYFEARRSELNWASLVEYFSISRVSKIDVRGNNLENLEDWEILKERGIKILNYSEINKMKENILFIFIFLGLFQNSIAKLNYTHGNGSSIENNDMKILKKREAFIFYQQEFDKLSGILENHLKPLMKKVTRITVDDDLTIPQVYGKEVYQNKINTPLALRRNYMITVTKQKIFEEIYNEGTAQNKLNVVYSGKKKWAAHITAINSNIILPIEGESDSIDEESLLLAIDTLFISSTHSDGIDDEFKRVKLETNKSAHEIIVAVILGIYLLFAISLAVIWFIRRRSLKNQESEKKSSLLKPQANDIDDDAEIEFVDE